MVAPSDKESAAWEIVALAAMIPPAGGGLVLVATQFLFQLPHTFRGSIPLRLCDFSDGGHGCRTRLA